MSELPPQHRVDYFIDRLANSVMAVPEVKPGIELAIAQPEIVAQVFSRYTELLGYMSRLTPQEQDRVDSAKIKLSEGEGHMGSASETSASELIKDVGQGLLSDLAAHALDTSPYTESALNILGQRMEGGHQLKISGKTPTDGDPESNKVIWGHTQITDPTALLHFSICHYLERYYAVELDNRGIAVAQQKDFLLNAMIDVVILDHLTTNQFDDIYELWVLPKPQGLGWLVKARLDSYQN